MIGGGALYILAKMTDFLLRNYQFEKTTAWLMDRWFVDDITYSESFVITGGFLCFSFDPLSNICRSMVKKGKGKRRREREGNKKAGRIKTKS